MAPFLYNNLQTLKRLHILIASICILIPIIFKSCDKDNFYPVIVNEAGLRKIISCQSLVEIDSAQMENRGKDTVYKLKICKADLLVDSIIKIEKRGYGFRSSLSQYAYSSKSYLFGLFYCMAAMLFIFNGAIYLNNIQSHQLNLGKNRLLIISKAGPWYNLVIGVSLLGVVFCRQYDLTFLHYVFTSIFFIGNFIVLAFFHNPGESGIIRICRIVLSFTVVISLSLLLYFNKISVLVAEWFSLAAIGLHLISAAIAANKAWRTEQVNR
jgi:hypothetical protein